MTKYLFAERKWRRGGDKEQGKGGEKSFPPLPLQILLSIHRAVLADLEGEISLSPYLPLFAQFHLTP
jgi:hypothetical protein